MKPELSEGQLLDILRWEQFPNYITVSSSQHCLYRDKDKAIVEFETQLRDKEKEKELLEEKITKQDLDVSSYLQLIEVKDQSIVKLSNQLDELELAVKIDKASTPPIVGKITFCIRFGFPVRCKMLNIRC